MFAHAYALMARPEDIPVVLGYPLQTLGVIIFFAISGYLITASFDRNRNPRHLPARPVPADLPGAGRGRGADRATCSGRW